MTLPSYESLPLVVDPSSERPCLRDTSSVLAWIRDRRGALIEGVARHGAVLVRGLPIRTADEFREVVRLLMPTLTFYRGGNSPRTHLGNNVYTSTEYPAQLELPTHNELACAHRFPSKLAFFCRTPATTGGETPIFDGRRMLAALPEDVRATLAARPIAYFRKLKSKRNPGPGKAWEDAFETSDRDRVEQICDEEGMEYAWTAGGDLKTKVVRKGVIEHPETGESTWFNQLVLFHPSSVPAAVRKYYPSDVREYHLFCAFDDGGAIPDDVVSRVRATISEIEVPIRWETGDILFLDNLLVSHGRRPFGGPRELLLAIA